MQALHFKLLKIYRKRFKYILSLCWLPKLNAPRRFNHFALLACPFISLVVPSDSPIDPVLTTSSLIIQTGGPCCFINRYKATGATSLDAWPLCNPATALISWTQNNGHASLSVPLHRTIRVFHFKASKQCIWKFSHFQAVFCCEPATPPLLSFPICLSYLHGEMGNARGSRDANQVQRRAKRKTSGKGRKTGRRAGESGQDTFEQIQ